MNKYLKQLGLHYKIGPAALERLAKAMEAENLTIMPKGFPLDTMIEQLTKRGYTVSLKEKKQ